MPEIKVTPLGAGQDVGRSCILVSIAGKNVMLDCGMHMGYNDDRRFPDFSYITQNGRLTDFLDCVIISHFHLDHCGALPYFSEMVGYDGPIYMTHPTKAICPILLEDYRKITVDKKGETNFFTSQMIKDCMKKVVAVHLHQTVQVDEELEIKAYYAGHVLGAAMFQIKVGCESVVYTGDYNMTPDRHLGAAWIDKCRPNLLISESTYATTIRDSKRCRERDFLKKVHETVERGGKVLIPVFALGRAQELCILLETFWLCLQPLECFMQDNPFRSSGNGQGMKKTWSSCQATVCKELWGIRFSVDNASWKWKDDKYAHADAKGIMQLIRQAEPQNVLLVHGEAKKMEFLKQKIEQEFHVNCYMPANGETTTIFTNPSIPVDISLGLLKRETAIGLLPDVKKPKLMHGTLIMKDNSFRLVSPEQALKELGLAEHQLRFTCRVHIQDPRKEHETVLRVYNHLKAVLKDYSVQHLPDGSITVESILIQATAHSEDQGTKVLLVSWTYQDEELGSYLTSLLKKGLPQSTS
ncbi:integrator complex subunit 11 isoform X2 [Rhea pennata]|uniref:integrator complex subunit 11 isoform X2 n=1 Tax=Rhea pennata TaxID=8795 RepID=UPI002E276BE3